MARYIDVDALLSSMPDDLPYKASVKRVLTQAPTADVVPKSKYDLAVAEREANVKGFTEQLAKVKSGIERLEAELDSKQFRCDSCDRIMLTGAEHRACITQAKADVAREIFEEIESICLKHIDRYDRYIMCCEDLTELKKKYTEGYDEGK